MSNTESKELNKTQQKTNITIAKKEKPKKLSPEEIIDMQLQHISRKGLNLCSNDKCYGYRQYGSAYCQKCSDKYTQKHKPLHI